MTQTKKLWWVALAALVVGLALVLKKLLQKDTDESPLSM